MKDTEITDRVRNAMDKQCSERGYATPVDVLIDLGVLDKQDYLKWRNGKVDYLERICHCNLSKLSKITKAVRSNAQKMGLKPSFTYYKQWGRKGSPKLLRFSKSGTADIEKNYATHYVVPKNREKKIEKNTIHTSNPNQDQQEAIPTLKTVTPVNRTERN